MLILGTFFFLQRFNRNKWFEPHNYHALPSPSSNHIAQRYTYMLAYYRNFIRISIVWHECLSAQAIQYGHTAICEYHNYLYLYPTHISYRKRFYFQLLHSFLSLCRPPSCRFLLHFFFIRLSIANQEWKCHILNRLCLIFARNEVFVCRG